MIRLLLGLIYLVLLFGMPLLAEAQIYDLTSYRSNGGLPDNHVYAIFQDHEGYIWFGTDEGVSRYDGKNYLNINEELIDSPVRWIFEDKSFNIWILTRGGISRYDGKAFTHYTKKNGLADDEARAGICTRDGHIWIGTKTGLSKFNGTSFESYNRNDGRPIQAVWNMFEDHEGVLWLALRGGGLLSYDGKNFREYTKESGLRTLDIFSITEDSNHTLWLATAEGLCRYDKKTFKHFTTADGLADNRVNAVVVDRHQRVWCSTFGGGLSRLQDGQFVNFNHLNGLPDNYLMALTQDYEGNIWAGTRRRGAFKFGSEQFTSYSFSGGDVSAITQAMDGTIWLSLPNNGLYSLDSQGQTRIYTTADGLLQEESIWTVYSDSKDRVWAGGEKGIYCYQKGNFKVFALKEIAAKVGIVERITTIIEDSEGKIWFGSNSARSGGALVYDGEGFRLYSSQHGLIYNQIESFALDRNKNLWICTDNGLSKFDGTAFTNFIPGDTFPDKRALCAHEDELGQLWVGTSNGLCKLTQDGFKVYGLKDGLPSTDIR
ncbi:MAG: hypothetical protein JNN15_17420, partial [Blastocatellia bacterium]|nr:hypothetical protein [Blastocatellia bacterium]